MIDALAQWALLPLGMALGWAFARKAFSNPDGKSATESDQASMPIDQSVRWIAEATGEGEGNLPELQLLLGNFFRKRGNVEHAIRLHEAVLAHPHDGVRHADAARFELAIDYQQAGLLDRSEQYWMELVEGRSPYAPSALEELIALAEQGQDWPQAITWATQLASVKGQSQANRIAHYHCQRAEQALARSEFDVAMKAAKQAQSQDSSSVRARWLQGQILSRDGDPKAAVARFVSAAELDARFLEDLVPAIEECCAVVGDPVLREQAFEDLNAMHPHAPALISAAASQRRALGQDALPTLARGLKVTPTRGLLKAFLAEIEPRPETESMGMRASAAAMHAALERMEQSAAGFRCEHCGFTPRNRFWQCPSCRQWGTIHRLSDQIG
jgi:lipopolysaccharide assembly protein B